MELKTLNTINEAMVNEDMLEITYKDHQRIIIPVSFKDTKAGRILLVAYELDKRQNNEPVASRGGYRSYDIHTLTVEGV